MIAIPLPGGLGVRFRLKQDTACKGLLWMAWKEGLLHA
jgi:hypothetical protein